MKFVDEAKITVEAGRVETVFVVFCGLNSCHLAALMAVMAVMAVAFTCAPMKVLIPVDYRYSVPTKPDGEGGSRVVLEKAVRI